MRRSLIRLLVSAAFLGIPVAGHGADDLTPLVGPTLPVPAPGAAMSLPPGYSFPRPNRLDVWQNYAVDRTNRWRPRVILTGEGAFYFYNGMRYPGLPINQLNVMPYLLD